MKVRRATIMIISIIVYTVIVLIGGVISVVMLQEEQDAKNKREVLTHICNIDQTTYTTSEDTKKEMTSVTFGSTDEEILLSIDMPGHHKIKKVIVIEER